MPIKLGELLVKANIISEGQLKSALAEQQKWGGKLGEILVRMNYCSEDIVVKALSKQLGIQRADLDKLPEVPPPVVRKLPIKLSQELDAVPLQLREEGKVLVVAIADPRNVQAIDTLRSRTGCRILTLIAGHSAIEKARAKLYFGEENIDSAADDGVKFTDSQGRTLVKHISEIQPPPKAPVLPQAPPAPPVAAAPRAGGADILDTIEEVQRKEVAALKAMVELLIEKGVFTRDEYLARVKR